MDKGHVRIRPEYQLRGWQGLPYALVKKGGARPLFMRSDAFRTVRFCNGRFTEDSPVFFGKRKEVLAQLDAIRLRPRREPSLRKTLPSKPQLR